jgi:hypothetical protein
MLVIDSWSGLYRQWAMVTVAGQEMHNAGVALQ